MEFEEYMKIGSGLIELTEDRKLKKNHLTQLKFFSLTEYNKHGVPQGSILRAPFFIIHVNVLPLRINSASEPILFADYTSFIITSRNFEEFFSLSQTKNEY
jgi:hypothetical protein